MTSYLDLELIQLDERGVWIDEQITGTDDPARPVPARRRRTAPPPTPRSAAPTPIGSNGFAAARTFPTSVARRRDEAYLDRGLASS